MRYAILLSLAIIGCDKGNKLYCAEGLHQPDGLHVYNSELEQAEGEVIPFSPPVRFEFYVVELSTCKSGFCIEDHRIGKLLFTGDSYILENGCHTN